MPAKVPGEEAGGPARLCAETKKTERRRFVSSLYILAGSLSLGLGIAGVFIPLLPTTPFLILAAACYARGSKKLHAWILQNRLFGKYLRDYLAGRGMPLRVKLVLLPVLWGTIGYSAFFAVHLWGSGLFSSRSRSP